MDYEHEQTDGRTLEEKALVALGRIEKAFEHIVRSLERLESSLAKLENAMNLDFTNVNAGIAGVQAAFQKQSADIAAALVILAGVTVVDGDQAKLDAVATTLGNIKTAADTSDAALEAVLNPPAAAVPAAAATTDAAPAAATDTAPAAAAAAQ